MTRVARASITLSSLDKPDRLEHHPNGALVAHEPSTDNVVDFRWREPELAPDGVHRYSPLNWRQYVMPSPYRQVNNGFATIMTRGGYS
ncbi:hypothetical protein MRX96_052188 [Rhipicephalus microplus]